MNQLNPGYRSEFELALQSTANVLITGATGTGKSLIARQIHEASSRAGRPFITVNLASVHEGTLESELFGHERGAFTGADVKKTGRLELANGGTLFLDEIGELTPRLQARLLEFLQSKTVVPVGGIREIKLDVRILSATHRDLEKEIFENKFREDLFHRLRVIHLHLRPLAERIEDLDEIVHSCLNEISQNMKRKILSISEATASLFEEYTWPGNIRELRNVLEYGVIACEGDKIKNHHLPTWFIKRIEMIRMNTNQSSEMNMDLEAPLGRVEFPISSNYHEMLVRFEKEFLRRALNHGRGRIGQTAKMIGVSKSTLARRVQAFGLMKQYQSSGEETEKPQGV